MGFAAVDVGEKKDVVGQVFVEDVDLKLASSDLFRKGQASGKASTSSLFRGDIRDIKSFKGDGWARMEDANLVKLPIFISMFKDVLKLQRIQETYFHKVEIQPFTIRNGRFRTPSWDSIVMDSDVMTLRGGGSIDFDLNLDLYMSLPSFLPAIPLVSDIWRRLIDNLVGFHVTGSVDDPKIGYIPIRDIISLFSSEK